MTTSRRAYVVGEIVRVRLTVGNPYPAPVRLTCRPGPGHDLTVRDRDDASQIRIDKTRCAEYLHEKLRL